jgi:hypothetical protein
MATRFTGARAWLSGWYRALWPQAAPMTVDAMTPSQIAAVLGLDQVPAVRLVPFTDDVPDAPPMVVTAPTPGKRPLRIRRVVGG